MAPWKIIGLVFKKEQVVEKGEHVTFESQVCLCRGAAKLQSGVFPCVCLAFRCRRGGADLGALERLMELLAGAGLASLCKA